MKKEKSIIGMILVELAVGAAEILLALAAFFGLLYLIGSAAELFDGMVSASTAVFALFTLTGLILYFDFRPANNKRSKTNRSGNKSAPSVQRGQKAIRAYQGR